MATCRLALHTLSCTPVPGRIIGPAKDSLRRSPRPHTRAKPGLIKVGLCASLTLAASLSQNAWQLRVGRCLTEWQVIQTNDLGPEPSRPRGGSCPGRSLDTELIPKVVGQVVAIVDDVCLVD